MNERADGREIEPGKQDQPEDSELNLEELDELLTKRTAELISANTRLANLEQQIAGKESEIENLKKAGIELEGKLETASSSLAEAVAGYKEMVVKASPEIVGEMVSGETIQAINESLEKAKALVNKVKQGLESEISLAKVPVGSPERGHLDFSTLSPREIIQYAIKK